jgi:hypothetical protein
VPKTRPVPPARFFNDDDERRREIDRLLEALDAASATPQPVLFPRDARRASLSALVVVVEESVQLRHHPSTGAHHDATNIVIVGGLVGDEDAVFRRNGTFRKLASLACAMCVESAVGDEHMEMYVQLRRLRRSAARR